MEFTKDLQTDLMQYFLLPLSEQQANLPALVSYLLELPAEQWSVPWPGQMLLEDAVTSVVTSPIMRGDREEEAAQWAGSYWVAWISRSGKIRGVASNVCGEHSRLDDQHLKQIAAVNAVCQVHLVHAGHDLQVSASHSQRYLNANVPLVGGKWVGSYYYRARSPHYNHTRETAVGAAGAEVDWAQRQQWLPGLTPTGPQSRSSALTGAFNDVFAKQVARRLAGYQGPCVESDFLTRLRVAH